MLNILSILSHIVENVHVDDRYNIIDNEHIIDKNTGVKFHMYEDYFKVTYDDKIIAKHSDFTPEEQGVVWQLKQAISDPVLAKKLAEEYPAKVKQTRMDLAHYFEVPQPLMAQGAVKAEVDTVVYKG